MSSIDNRIVNIEFNNSKFAQGVRPTLDMLEKLKAALKLDGAKKSLEGVSNEAKRFSLSNIGQAIDNISGKFSAFGAIGFTALQRLTNSAIDLGKKMASSLIDPLVNGGRRRAENIQQAKFQFQGLGMDIEKAMSDASFAVDGTAFGLDEAARAAGQLGASGVELGDDMRTSLRGVSGLASMTGSSYEDISRIFVQVAGNGRLMGDQLLQIGGRGINAAQALVKYFQEVEGQSNITEQAVREMTSKGQIDFQTFANAMNHAFGDQAMRANELFSGAMSNMRAALSRIGEKWWTPELLRQRDLLNAIRPVINDFGNAITPLIDSYNRIKDVSTASKIDFIEGIDLHQFARFVYIIAGALDSLHETIQFYKKPIADAFKLVFASTEPPNENPWFIWLAWDIKALVDSLRPAGLESYHLLTTFTRLFTALKNVGAVVGGLIRYWVDTWIIIKDLAFAVGGLLVPVIEWLVGLFRGGSSGVKDFSDTITDFFDGIISFRRSGVDAIIGFLENLRGILDSFLNRGGVSDWGVEWEKAFEPFISMGDQIKAKWGGTISYLSDILTPVVKVLADQWGRVKDSVSAVWGFIAPVATAVWNFLKTVAGGIRDFFAPLTFEQVLAGVNTGLIATFLFQLRKGLKLFGKGGMFSGISDAISGLGDALRNLTNKESLGDKLIKMSAAIAILALALMALTFVDQSKLSGAGIAIAALFGSLLGSMKVISMIATTKDMAKLPSLALIILTFAAALLIMANALDIIGGMETANWLKGLGGLLVAVTLLTGAMVVLSKLQKDIVKGTGAMVIMAVAVAALAGAVWLFGSMPMDVLVQGGIAVAAAIAVMTGAAVILSKWAGKMLLAAAGIMVMVQALAGLVGVLYLFAKIPPEVYETGMERLGYALLGLTAVAVILGNTGGNMLKAAVGLLAMAAALAILVIPIRLLGGMDPKTLVQGMVAIGIALAGLVVASMLLSKSQGGAAAMIAMAAAVVILSLALSLLSVQNQESLRSAILSLAIALGVMAIAGYALAPVAVPLLLVAAALAVMSIAVAALGVGLLILTPALALFITTMGSLSEHMLSALAGVGIIAALGVALVILGAGLVVAGAGVVIFSAGLILFGVGLGLIATFGPMGAVAIAALVQTVAGLVKYVGDVLKMSGALAVLGLAIVVLSAGIAVLGVGALLLGVGVLALVAAFALFGSAVKSSGDEVLAFVESSISLLPLLGAALALAMVNFLTIIGEAVPKIIEVFSSIVSGILDMITENIPKFLEMAVTFFSGLLDAGLELMPKLMDFVSTLITSLIDLILEKVPEIVQAGIDLMIGLLNGIAEKVPELASAASNLIVTMIEEIGKMAGDISQAGIDTIVEFINGITEKIDDIIQAGTDLIIALIEGIGNSATDIMQAAGDTMRTFLSALEDEVEQMGDAFASLGRTIASSVISGLTGGLLGGKKKAFSSGQALGEEAMKGMKKGTDSHSPSKAAIRIGHDVGDGLVIGLKAMGDKVHDEGDIMGRRAVDAVSEAIAGIPTSVYQDMTIQPTIRPVVDLSEVRNGANQINSIFGNKSRSRQLATANEASISKARVSADISAEGTQSGSTTVNNNYYTQNLHSPKPLSRVDIYRQTKNLMGGVKPR